MAGDDSGYGRMETPDDGLGEEDEETRTKGEQVETTGAILEDNSTLLKD